MSNSLRLLGLALLALVAALVGVGLTRLTRDDSPRRATAWATSPPLEETQLMDRRILAREAVVHQLIAKELNLFDAAVMFRRLNEEAGQRQQVYWQSFPGRCDNEKACRQVLLWVRKRLEEDKAPPSQLEATIQTLEKQLDEHIAEHGKVLLPEGR